MLAAIYRMRVFDYDAGYTSFYVRVEVIGESNKSYRIRFMQQSNGERVGTTKWVRKYNVKIVNA